MTGKDFANPLRKTHSLTFESKQLFYPWHRWHRLELLTRKGTGPHSEHSLWCRLPEDPPDAAMVAIPLWMFDAAVCATMRLGDQPSVDCAALRALQDLIANCARAARARCYNISSLNRKTETLMPTTKPPRFQIGQLALFCEQRPLPRWSGLPEPLRAEVIRNLARLLRSVRDGNPESPRFALPNQGDRNE